MHVVCIAFICFENELEHELEKCMLYYFHNLQAIHLMLVLSYLSDEASALELTFIKNCISAVEIRGLYEMF